jgi:hypothetical protein
MQNIKEESLFLASLAVFRELYNSQKDIYGVIGEFLNGIIKSNKKYKFNLTEITNLLNNIFDFDIPEAIVHTSLRRLDYLKKEQGVYLVKNKSKENVLYVNTLQEKAITSNNTLIETLFSFIVQEKNIELSDSERKKIVHSFCSFLMDSSDGGEYSEYISGFILKNKQDEEFRSKLNTIREGVILYSGIKYNNNLSEVGSWKTELTIYLDTEILFHFSGYNGQLYRSLFDDFFKYVNEINNKAQKRLIKLRYFREVKNEIKDFFTKAEYIVEGKDNLNPKMTAMSSIIEGCSNRSDIMDKKSDFFLLFKTNGIIEDETTDYFDEKNYEHNIVDQNTIKAVSNEYGFDIIEHLRYLNYIHVHRKEAKANNFYNIGCIFLTGNSKTIKVAWHKMIKPKGVVPLATTLFWITNKLWFKLNKGFGNGAIPKSFDVITKAQIILSSVLNESVGEKYNELQTQFKDGNITKEQVKARIVNLRNQARKPEDITSEDISSILDVMSEDSLEEFIKEQEHFKNKAEKQVEENIILKRSLTQKEKEIEKYEKNKTALTSQVIETKEMLLQEKQNSIEILENQKRPIDIEITQALRWLKIKILGLIVLFYALSYFLISKYGWDNLEQWTWIISVTFPVILSASYMFAAEKTINPLELLKHKKRKIQEHKYSQFNFDISLLEKLKLEKDNLKNEIDELNKSTL